ncbi:MAG: FAD-binding and (Fe-S)-binding domain-containing protein, partial [Planctomycetota bacterium]
MISKATEAIAADLAKIVKGDVFIDIFHRAAFSSDASIYQIIPECIVAPRDTEDVACVVRYAGDSGLPVAARGAGSGLAGESLCSGIVLDMTPYMNSIIEIRNEGEVVVCEPGIALDSVNEELAKYSRMIGPDPSSSNRATVGGVVANNATGAHSLKYGHIEAYIDSVEAVLADGAVVQIGNDIEPENLKDDRVVSIAQNCMHLLEKNKETINKAVPRTRRNRCGYNVAGICGNGRIDLARMLAGSEGTLAVLTKIALRTVEVPKFKGLLQLEFDSIEKMAKSVPIIVGCGATACELMDKSVVDMAADALPQYRDVLAIGAVASLLVEHTGQAEDEVREKIKKTDSKVGQLANKRSIVLDTEQQQRLWKSRKDAVPLLYRKRGPKKPVPFMEDVSVDNSLLAEYVAGLEKIKQQYGIEQMSFYGHAGDGELHVRPHMDLSSPAEVEKMRAIANDVFELAWSLGGSISGEHADGLVRTPFIRKQYGDEYYDVLRGIKDIFDSDGLMNPGKIISDDVELMVKNIKAQHWFLPERLESQLLFDKDELKFELGQCNGCGLCLSRAGDLRMCPVYRALGKELGSSRAKANILRFWATGQLKAEDFESEEFKEILSLCTNCKMCSLQCPSGVDVSKLIITTRAEYAKRKGLKRAERILSCNRYLSILSSKFAPIANLVMGLRIVRWVLEKLSGLDSRRKMPKFGFGSFLSKGRKYLAKQGSIENPVDKVAYFVDTYANYNDHELG